MMRLDSPELAANTPPLHYQCRSILSPVTKYDLRDMEKPGWKDEEGKTFEELLDWRKVTAPQKGFGELGRITEISRDNNIPDSGILAQPSKRKPRSMEIIKTYPEENSRKIYVQKDVEFPIVGFKKKEIELIESALDRAPARHLNGINSIIVTNNELYAYKGTTRYIANAQYHELSKEITLNRRQVKLAPKKEAIKVKSRASILHEVGHHYQYNYLIQQLGESVEGEIIKAAQKDKNEILKIRGATYKEYFANAYAYWFLSNSALAEKHSLIYNILSRVFEVAQ